MTIVQVTNTVYRTRLARIGRAIVGILALELVMALVIYAMIYNAPHYR